MQKLAGIALIVFLILGAAAPSPAADTTQLKWVLFSLGGRTVKVRPGGILSLHPDAHFRVAKIETDSWLGLGLSYTIKEMPKIDLSQYHTLTQLLGDEIYADGKLTFQVFKDKRLLGQIQLMPRLLPIDWLRRAEAAKDLSHKIEYTKKALDITPDDTLISKRLVDLLIDARRYGEAAAILEDFAAANGSPEIYSRLAELYRQLEEPEHETAVLNKLLAWDPGNMELMKRLIDLQIKRKNYEAAAVHLEMLLAKLPKGERSKTYQRLAKVQTLAGKEKQALVAWEIAADLDPDNVKLWLTLSAARAKAGDKKGAKEAFQKAAQLSPKNIDMQRQLAEQLLGDGNQDQAAQALELAYEQNPDDASLLLRLIRIYEELGNRPKLFDTYERLAELQTNDPSLHYSLAMMSYEDGNFKQALEYCRRADLLKPGDPDIQDLRFELLHKLNDKAGMLEYAKQVLSRNPADLRVLNFIYEPLKEEYGLALSILLDKAIATGPKEAGVYELRYDLAQSHKKSKDAITALEAGIKALPDDQDMLWTLSVLYYNDDRPQKEFEVLSHLVELNSKYPGAAERFSALKEELREKQKEAELKAKEAELDPDPDKLLEQAADSSADPAEPKPEDKPGQTGQPGDKAQPQAAPEKPAAEIETDSQPQAAPAETKTAESIEETPVDIKLEDLPQAQPSSRKPGSPAVDKPAEPQPAGQPGQASPQVKPAESSEKGPADLQPAGKFSKAKDEKTPVAKPEPAAAAAPSSIQKSGVPAKPEPKLQTGQTPQESSQDKPGVKQPAAKAPSTLQQKSGSEMEIEIPVQKETGRRTEQLPVTVDQAGDEQVVVIPEGQDSGAHRPPAQAVQPKKPAPALDASPVKAKPEQEDKKAGAPPKTDQAPITPNKAADPAGGQKKKSNFFQIPKIIKKPSLSSGTGQEGTAP